MIREPLKMITCLIGAAWISFPLLIVSLVSLPLGGAIINSLSKRMKRSTQRELEGMSQIFRTLIETFDTIKTVRIFNREPSERKRFKGNSNGLCRISLKIAFYDSLIRPVTEMLGIVSISLSILVGAYLVINQETHIFNIQISDRPLSPGQLLLFFTMLAGASDPARKMSEVINQLVRGGMVSESLQKTFDIAPEVVARTPGLVLPIHKNEIRFDSVQFGYRERHPVVKGVSFSIPFGQSVGIVGGNGCGKSTLMNLMARFYDPQQGRILIDGVDIRDVSPRKLRQQIGWVTHEASLFQGTIWENIAYGAPNTSDDKILAAAELAMVPHFANMLPAGLHAPVGDSGRRLSAGQRQRVALARAILADPQILILDEATSQIDGKTESLVHEGLLDFIQQRTTFVVTHRFSSLRLTERVLIMEAGKIVFDGPTSDASIRSQDFQYLFQKSAA
jgi:ATP-binding cassette subfamily B protein/subfamily B ATP-binding cassette protein MsbA